ncbi:MAG: DUF503 domain-containing protein, partial [Deltaproteobacteria bacterium]|nr:DUF503 domain-containing protein [Deltaproteobacteria bacterium]
VAGELFTKPAVGRVFSGSSSCRNKEREMVVGVCQLELYLHDNFSLKGKRQVLKSITQRARQRFNIAIAEVADQDLWQKAVLGICAVGNDRQRVNSTLDQVINFIEETQLTDVADSQIEIINY